VTPTPIPAEAPELRPPVGPVVVVVVVLRVVEAGAGVEIEVEAPVAEELARALELDVTSLRTSVILNSWLDIGGYAGSTGAPCSVLLGKIQKKKQFVMERLRVSGETDQLNKSLLGSNVSEREIFS
jgi:hypothetical protein